VLRAALGVLERELLAEAKFPDVPGYTFLKELARGPMGVVYRVRSLADGRELALKTIPSAQIARWSHCLPVEGEVLTELRHPHIVPVESFGEYDGLHHLVMPLVQGGDLRQRLREFVLGAGRRDRLERIESLMGKVASAVAFLHQRGILHRDLKPSNILLTQLGDNAEPLVCDFGLARRMSEPQAGTRSPQMVGTLAYMAPEQMEGRQELTEAADIWSLGAILYELLTGHPPFTEKRPLDTQQKLTADEPLPPAEANPDVAGTVLGTICRRCLQRDLAARYRSAAELAADLLGVQVGSRSP
jgi:serine/threonine-protein kinase